MTIKDEKRSPELIEAKRDLAAVVPDAPAGREHDLLNKATRYFGREPE
jgi:hypothetical protein